MRDTPGNYAVWHTAGAYRAVAIPYEQAEQWRERGWPLYQHRRAWAIARSLNRREELSDEGHSEGEEES